MAAIMLWKLIRWPLWIALAGLLAYVAFIGIQIGWFRANNPDTTAFMRAEMQRLSGLRPPVTIRQTWVPYGRIATTVKQAVIASEDSGFVHHDGVEWEAIEKAAAENAKRGKIKRGGSTITMQLAKNLFLSSDRSYVRKAQEIVIAGVLELAMDKRRILEIYLNTAEWGIGIFGVEAASRHYFGVSASEIDSFQAAWLASILPAPKRFDRNRESEWLTEKSLIILERMPKVALPK